MNTKTEHNRVLVVDGSRVARHLLASVVKQELDAPEVLSCATGAEALKLLTRHSVDFATIALRLPDMDGLELTRRMREAASQHFFPVIVVSGDVTRRLHQQGVLAEVTDYFDKSLGLSALGAFVHGYLTPDPELKGQVLLVEDSKVVSLATERLLRKHGLEVIHAGTVDDAIERLSPANSGSGPDLVLTDFNLKGDKSGYDLLKHLRDELGLSRDRLPALVITGESNAKQHASLLRAGANDLVEKPIQEALLVKKLRFQLQLRRQAAQNQAAVNQ